MPDARVAPSHNYTASVLRISKEEFLPAVGMIQIAAKLVYFFWYVIGRKTSV